MKLLKLSAPLFSSMHFSLDVSRRFTIFQTKGFVVLLSKTSLQQMYEHDVTGNAFVLVHGRHIVMNHDYMWQAWFIQ